MKCRQCGAEIAEKALICYRCGAATTESTFKPPTTPRRSPWVTLIVAILALAVGAAIAVYYGRQPVADTPRYISVILVSLAVFVVALRAYFRRRR